MAALVTELVPTMDMVRMVNSGTEATMSAIRFGPRLHRPRQNYQVRRLLPRPRRLPAGKAGSGALTLGQPNSPACWRISPNTP